MRRSNVVGGLMLIFFGLIFLASNLGYIDPGYFHRLGQLWPLWLVVGGLMLLAHNYPALRIAAGSVVVIMLLVALTDPGFLDSFHGYRYWRHSWGPSSFWGLLFLVGGVWFLYSVFGRNKRATE